jgi:hypothetical protein
MQPCGNANDVLIEFRDSSTLVDFMVMDMDPHQQTSIILGKPFLKSIRATIDKKRGIINIKVDRVHDKLPTLRGAYLLLVLTILFTCTSCARNPIILYLCYMAAR